MNEHQYLTIFLDNETKCQSDWAHAALSIYLDHQMKYQSDWLLAAALLVLGRPPVYSDEGQREYHASRNAWCDWATSDAVRSTIQAIADRSAGSRLELEAAIAGAPF